MLVTIRRAAMVRIAILSAIALCGCKKAEIEGKVIDGLTKSGIPDVKVSIVGTTFQSTTGKDGRYRIPYAPGQVTVGFARTGFSASSFTASLAQKTKYPASDITLYRVPERPGVWLVDAAGKYIAAEGADICSESQTGMEGYAFVTVVTFTITDLSSYTGIVPAGRVTVLDNSGEGLDLVGVQSGGEIWRRRSDMMRARESVQRFAPVEEQSIAGGMLLRRYDLPAGAYAMVHVNRNEEDEFFGTAHRDLISPRGYQFAVGNSGLSGGQTPCVLGD